MCVVSMVSDHYMDKWKQYPWMSQPYTQGGGFGGAGAIPSQDVGGLAGIFSGPSRHEFEDLKKDVAEMVALLKRAKIYDEKNNEPNCELAEKVEVLKRVAKLVGVNLASLGLVSDKAVDP